MYPGAATDSTLARGSPPWRLPKTQPERSRIVAPPTAEHDPALLVAALDAIRKRDEALEWLVEAELLALLLA